MALAQDSPPNEAANQPATASPAAETPAVATSDNSGSSELTVEALDTLLEQIEASDLEDPTKERGRQLVRQARDDLRLAETMQADSSTYDERLKSNMPQADRDRLQEKLDEVKRSDPSKPWLGDPLPKLEQELAEKQRLLAQRKAEMAQFEETMSRRATRTRALREGMASHPQELANVTKELETQAQSTEPPLIAKAIEFSLLAKKRRLELFPAAAQNELALYAAEDALDIPQLRRTYLTESIADAELEAKAWEEAVMQRRREDAAARLELARRQRDQAREELEPVYAKNVTVVEAELEIRRDWQAAQAQLDRVREQIDVVKQQFSDAVERHERARSSRALGLRLRQQREQLPNVTEIRHQRQELVRQIEDAQLEYLDWTDEQRVLGNLDPLVNAVVDKIAADGVDEEDAQRIEKTVRSAFEQQRNFVASTVKAYDDYLETIEAIDFEKQSLIDQTNAFAEFIDERVLWIRSHSTLTVRLLFTEWGETIWLLRGPLPADLLRGISLDIMQNLWLYAVACCSWLVLLFSMRRAKRAVQRLGKRASSRLNTDFQPTVRAGLLTAVLSLVWPLPVLFFGWRLLNSPEASALAQDFSRRMLNVAFVFLFFEVVRQTCRQHGLAEDHFRWPSRCTQVVYRNVRWFIVLATPLATLSAALLVRPEPGEYDSLERTAMIVVQLLFAVLMYQVTRTRGGVFDEWLAESSNGWRAQLLTLLHVVAVAVPVCLAGLSIAGFTYTAVRLSEQVVETLQLIFGIVMIREIAVRWLSMRQRRLTVERARQRRAAIAEAARDPSRSETAIPDIPDETNLTDLSTQTKRLLNTTLFILALVGIWVAWIDVLPALNYLNERNIPGTSIKWSGLTSAVLLAILTATAGRNVPGLLEMMLLERLPLDRSARYATTTILRYVIMLLGVIGVSRALAIEWSQVQWLAAALTFGLGFGLQEIFANFVSGLIILFEQPVRVGDIVTIDGVTGIVSRIRIRSTTITDWDRKEYIVPNKEFITGRLLNWTLTDTINRIVINVGVTYSCDPAMARDIVRKVATDHPLIMADPGPIVSFEGFGDSSLSIVLRAYLPNLDNRLMVIDELHTQIHRALSDAGIEIPFPQRDLHIRSSDLPFFQQAPNGAQESDPHKDDTGEGHNGPASRDAAKESLVTAFEGTPTGRAPSGPENL